MEDASADGFDARIGCSQIIAAKWRDRMFVKPGFQTDDGKAQRCCLERGVSARCASNRADSEILRSQLVRERAARPFTLRKFRERCAKIGDRKIRPAFVQENKFGKRTFP